MLRKERDQLEIELDSKKENLQSLQFFNEKLQNKISHLTSKLTCMINENYELKKKEQSATKILHDRSRLLISN